jgi:hypothetical protein
MLCCAYQCSDGSCKFTALSVSGGNCVDTAIWSCEASGLSAGNTYEWWGQCSSDCLPDWCI